MGEGKGGMLFDAFRLQSPRGCLTARSQRVSTCGTAGLSVRSAEEDQTHHTDHPSRPPLNTRTHMSTAEKQISKAMCTQFCASCKDSKPREQFSGKATCDDCRTKKRKRVAFRKEPRAMTADQLRAENAALQQQFAARIQQSQWLHSNCNQQLQAMAECNNEIKKIQEVVTLRIQQSEQVKKEKEEKAAAAAEAAAAAVPKYVDCIVPAVEAVPLCHRTLDVASEGGAEMPNKKLKTGEQIEQQALQQEQSQTADQVRATKPAEYGTPALSAETPAKHEVHTQQTYGEASSSTVKDVFTVLEREHKDTCIGADGYSLQSPQQGLPIHDDFFPSFFRDGSPCNRATSEDAIALLG